MPLYSSDTLSHAAGGNPNEAVRKNAPEAGLLPEGRDTAPWFYLFAYHSKAESVNCKLQEQFRTFIHKTFVYRREGKRIVKEEKPSISGLLFVQGESAARIQEVLDHNFPGIHLVRDYYTKKIVSIPHRVMLPFMQISQVGAERIRFMPNSLGYYSTGHVKISVTSGLLAGLEGYIVRIAREKRLVTSIGNMTVAISGISKESFENAEEYARSRKEQEADTALSDRLSLTPQQAEIDSCFFASKTRLDVLVIARSMDKWIARAKDLAAHSEGEKATDILLFILEEIGSRLYHVGDAGHLSHIKDIVDDMCGEIVRVLASVEAMPDTPEPLKERIEMEKQSLEMRFPMLFAGMHQSDN